MGEPIRRKSWPRQSLTGGMIMVVVLALVPLALFGIVAGRRAIVDAETIAIAQLRAAAAATADRVRDPFVIGKYLIQSAARMPAVQSAGPGCVEGLRTAMPPGSLILNVARSDRTGKILCSVTPVPSGMTLARQSWWDDAINRNEVTVTGRIDGIIMRQPIFLIALPVLNEEDQPDGLVTASIAVKDLNAMIAQGAHSREGVASLVAPDGTVVAGENPLVIARGIESQGVQTDRDGRNWFYATAPVLGPNLTVVYAEPQQQAMAPAMNSMRSSIILPLLAMLFTSLAIWFGTSQLIVRWIRKLQGQAHRLADGDYAPAQASFHRAPADFEALSGDLDDVAAAIRLRNSELVQAADLQADLAREVQHRVKNNLQMIASMLTLQLNREDDESARIVLRQTLTRIAALGLLYRLAYQSATGDRGLLHLREVMTTLCPDLRNNNPAGQRVDIHCESAEAIVSLDVALPIVLFIVEAVTNALQHGYHGNRCCGVVHVSFRRTCDRQVRLEVRDDGIGYDVGATDRRVGNDLMSAFAMQLNGALTVESTLERGTLVAIDFSLPDIEGR